MRAIVFTAAAALALGAAPLELNAQARAGDRVQGRAEDARTRGAQQRGPTSRDDRARAAERDRRDERGSARDQRSRSDRGSASGRATDRRGDWENDRRGGRDDRYGQARGNGPPFCNTRQGHPVHGQRWCQEKGFGSRWERATWGDVILRNPRRAERQNVGGGTLGDILGDVVFGRVDSHRRAMGITQGLVGRWERDSAGHGVLRVSAGGVPVAEFIDQSGNGRAEIVRINRGR
jgi:hypothetical protein